jgi:hypothetical protein
MMKQLILGLNYLWTNFFKRLFLTMLTYQITGFFLCGEQNETDAAMTENKTDAAATKNNTDNAATKNETDTAATKAKKQKNVKISKLFHLLGRETHYLNFV